MLDLFDQLIGACEQRWGDGQTGRLGWVEVDEGQEPQQLLDRSVGGISALEDAIHIGGGVTPIRHHIGSTAHEHPFTVSKLNALTVGRRYSIANAVIFARCAKIIEGRWKNRACGPSRAMVAKVSSKSAGFDTGTAGREAPGAVLHLKGCERSDVLGVVDDAWAAACRRVGRACQDPGDNVTSGRIPRLGKCQRLAVVGLTYLVGPMGRDAIVARLVHAVEDESG